MKLIKKYIKKKVGKSIEPENQTRGLEMLLLNEVKNKGCPICSSTASHDKRYLSWFPMETYHEPGFLEKIKSSYGFCTRHGAFLDTQSQLLPQLSFVHDHVVQKVCEKLNLSLSGKEKDLFSLFPDPSDCPVCASFKSNTQRILWFFQKLMKEGIAFTDYGHPGIMCFRHFMKFSEKASPEVIYRLIPLHEKAIASAVNAMENADSSMIQAGIKSDVCREALLLSVGPVLNTEDLMSLHRIYCRNPGMDPVADFTVSLENKTACPVCLEQYAAMSQWINWLDNYKICGMDDIDQLFGVLPTCREHVLACVHLGRPALQFAAVYASLKAAQTNILIAAKQLRTLQGKNSTPVWQKLAKKDKNSGQAGKIDIRKAVTSPIRCPMCIRINKAEQRALDLLLALLESSRHRKAFENGHGLCMKHFIQAVKLAPYNDMRKLLTEVESAKLSFLKWELDETMRKMAWDTRPEPKGSEQSAWHSGFARFSGLPPANSIGYLSAPDK